MRAVVRSWSEIAGDAWGMLCDCLSQLCSRSSQQIIAGHNVEQLLHRLWLQKLGCVAWRDRPALPARRLRTVAAPQVEVLGLEGSFCFYSRLLPVPCLLLDWSIRPHSCRFSRSNFSCILITFTALLITSGLYNA